MPSLLYGPNFTSVHDTGKTIALTIWTFGCKVIPIMAILLYPLGKEEQEKGLKGEVLDVLRRKKSTSHFQISEMRMILRTAV